MITFQCANCGRKISVPEKHAGKKGKCPGCTDAVVVPTESPLQLASDEPAANPPGTDRPAGPLPARGRSVPNVSSRADHQAKTIPQRPVVSGPYTPLTALAYPMSMSGSINLVIFWLAIPILYLALAAFPLIAEIGEFVIAAYMYYYFTECVRDSATGGTKAPENIANQPDKEEAMEQLMQIVAAAVIFWGPAVFYWVFTRHTGAIFWGLFGYGAFFFPMGLLAIIMFSSTAAYNPILWISSIFSTFVPYCMLLLGLAIPACVLAVTIRLVPNPVLAWLATGPAWIYFAMVEAHLLGRFYYRNAEKLNWEV